MRETLKAGLERLGYRIGRLPPLASESRFALQIDFDYVIAHYLSRRADPRPFYFVQVGAFDGVTNDRLHAHVREGGWRGVLVEPQSRPFARLVENYGDLDGLTFVNAAVDREKGSRALYVVQDECGEPIEALAPSARSPSGACKIGSSRMECVRRRTAASVPSRSHA